MKIIILNIVIYLEVPKYEENSRGLAYYMRPSTDGKRKGKFYINTKNLKSIPKYEVTALSLHENIPGHHYQLSKSLDNNLPKFLKYFGFTSYIEGWGLYSENLIKYNYDLNYFGKLNYELHRSVRLVVDTGIHYFNWNFEKCEDFMKKYIFMSENDIEKEIMRYIAIPGQALSYKIGELTIKKLRNEFLKKNRNKNIKDFHKKLLDIGAIPLFLLKEYI